MMQEAFEGAGWLSCGRQRLLLCSLQNSHGDIAWYVSEVHLHTQIKSASYLAIHPAKLPIGPMSGRMIIQIE